MKKLFSLPLAALVVVALGACAESGADVSAPELEAPSETLERRGGVPGEARGASASQAPGDDPIALIAIESGFDSLVVALGYVDAELEPSPGLVDLFLNGTDQYTVFAPTNAAFETLLGALGAGAVSDLPAAVVLDVLLYHVTDGRRGSNSVVPKNGERTIETLLGETFAVQPDLSIEDGFAGTDADIVAADISASNGIIHVVDEVLVPASVVAGL